jgi:transposase
LGARFKHQLAFGFAKISQRPLKCSVCQKPFSESFEFTGERRRHTDRFAQMIVQQVIHSDLHNVAKQHDLMDEEVASIVQYLSKKNACGGERTEAVRNG